MAAARDTSHRAEESPRALERRLVRRVAQQCLANALAQDARLAARGAQHDPRGLLAVVRDALGLQPAWTAIERQPGARCRLDLHAGEPGHIQIGLRVEPN